MEKKYQLPKEFGEKWVKALRSGRYKQTTDMLLRRNDGECKYCCLGVACRVERIPANKLFEVGYTDKPFMIGKLPIELIGVPSENRLIKELTTKNDSGNFSFPEIADWIEANVQFI